MDAITPSVSHSPRAAALAAGSMLTPARPPTGSISIRIVSAGFIFGASVGSGILRFRGPTFD